MMSGADFMFWFVCGGYKHGGTLPPNDDPYKFEYDFNGPVNVPTIGAALPMVMGMINTASQAVSTIQAIKDQLDKSADPLTPEQMAAMDALVQPGTFLPYATSHVPHFDGHLDLNSDQDQALSDHAPPMVRKRQSYSEPVTCKICGKQANEWHDNYGHDPSHTPRRYIPACGHTFVADDAPAPTGAFDHRPSAPEPPKKLRKLRLE